MAADRARACVVLALVAIVGCTEERKLELGAQCDLSSECEAPLACRLERCRVECATVRDCDIGAACLFDELGLGACQLPDERDCNADSECPKTLVCRFRQCVNECRHDRDCPPGSACEADSAGDLACVDAAERGCESHADCPAPLVCANDDVCRDECRTDRDCRGGTLCDDGVCVRPAPPSDAGTDAGEADGGTDGGTLDGGPVDGGPTDSGTTTDGGTDAGGPALLESAVQVEAARTTTSCAVTDAGSLLCWGDVAFDASTLATTPVDFGGLTDAQQVSLGEGFGCVLRSIGTVRCWGSNWAGQLGDGTSTDSATLVDVAGLPAGIAAVRAGHNHVCARTATGEVWCWGLNDNLQSGGASYTQPTPTRIGTFTDAAQLAAGYDHNCVLHTGGTVSCWGGNFGFQLASETIDETATPVAIGGITDATAVGTGHSTSCVLRPSGEVWCWGSRDSGGLGDGATSPDTATPGPVTALSDATALAIGAFHSCALRSSGEAVCWGSNVDGQLGNGLSVRESTTPVRVLGLSDIVALDAGQDHTCALRAGGHVSCWGSNVDGALGYGVLGGSSRRPQSVLAP